MEIGRFSAHENFALIATFFVSDAFPLGYTFPSPSFSLIFPSFLPFSYSLPLYLFLPFSLSSSSSLFQTQVSLTHFLRIRKAFSITRGKERKSVSSPFSHVTPFPLLRNSFPSSLCAQTNFLSSLHSFALFPLLPLCFFPLLLPCISLPLTRSLSSPPPSFSLPSCLSSLLLLFLSLQE